MKKELSPNQSSLRDLQNRVRTSSLRMRFIHEIGLKTRKKTPVTQVSIVIDVIAAREIYR